MRFLFSLSSS
ncbi:hypothetical protein LINPERPRIM_LOCUS35023 [Linum perenne]